MSIFKFLKINALSMVLPNSVESAYKSKTNTFHIVDAVKDIVAFQDFNLLSSSYPATLQDIDVIFYRNVAIYFESSTQRRVFQKLSHILNENGYLVTSSTETLPHNLGMLSLIEIDRVFLYHKNEADGQRSSHVAEIPLASQRCPPAVVEAPVDSGIETAEDSHVLFQAALALANNKQYKEALDCIDNLIKADTFFTEAYALKSSILINVNNIEDAKKVCLDILKIDGFFLETYLLLGIIAKMKNRNEEVLNNFKQAIYIQPACWLAHFYLADSYRSLGDKERACHAYEIAAKLLKEGGPSSHGLTFFPLSFSVEQLIHLCHHHLDELKEQLGYGI